MSIDINKILNKKKWTGKEVGKVLIYSLITDHRRKDNSNLQQLCEPNKFYEMLNSLKNNSSEYNKYLVYSDSYNGILESYDYGQAMYQQMHHAYYRILTDLQFILQYTIIKIEEKKENIDNIKIYNEYLNAFKLIYDNEKFGDTKQIIDEFEFLINKLMKSSVQFLLYFDKIIEILSYILEVDEIKEISPLYIKSNITKINIINLISESLKRIVYISSNNKILNSKEIIENYTPEILIDNWKPSKYIIKIIEQELNNKDNREFLKNFRMYTEQKIIQDEKYKEENFKNE